MHAFVPRREICIYLDMSSAEFLIDLPEHVTSINCSVLRLPRAIFIWAGTGNALGHLSAGVPCRSTIPSKAVGSIVLDNSSRATQLSARLATLLRLQVMMSGDLPDEGEHLWQALEQRLLEEIQVRPELFSQAH